MTDLKQIDLPDNAPKWAIKAFEYDGDVVFKNKHGQMKKRNGHFLKGFSGNKGGLSSNHAQQILRVRTMCLDALENKGLPRIIKELSNHELSARDLVAIVKFLSETSIPKQVEDTTEQNNVIPRIVITSEAMARAEELDRQYTEDASVSS